MRRSRRTEGETGAFGTEPSESPACNRSHGTKGSAERRPLRSCNLDKPRMRNGAEAGHRLRRGAVLSIIGERISDAGGDRASHPQGAMLSALGGACSGRRTGLASLARLQGHAVLTLPPEIDPGFELAFRTATATGAPMRSCTQICDPKNRIRRGWRHVSEEGRGLEAGRHPKRRFGRNALAGSWLWLYGLRGRLG